MFKRKQLPPRPAIVYRPVSGGTASRVADTVNAQPKTKPLRCPALLELAQGKQCLLKIPGVCAGGMADAVADRVDRLRAVGNGQVPRVAAFAFSFLSAVKTPGPAPAPGAPRPPPGAPLTAGKQTGLFD